MVVVHNVTRNTCNNDNGSCVWMYLRNCVTVGDVRFWIVCCVLLIWLAKKIFNFGGNAQPPIKCTFTSVVLNRRSVMCPSVRGKNENRRKTLKRILGWYIFNFNYSIIYNISILVFNYYNSIIASNNFVYKNVIVSYSRIITTDNRNRD